MCVCVCVCVCVWFYEELFVDNIFLNEPDLICSHKVNGWSITIYH